MPAYAHRMVASPGLTARWRETDPRFRRFVTLLAVATALPMLAIPLMQGAPRDATATLALASLLTFLGGPAHVSLTSWFYADPVARAHFFAHPLRYFVVPLALIVGTTLAYAVWQGGQPTRWINFFFTVWLLWHYQRQNWGVHSFVTRVVSNASASHLENWILRVAVVGGIIGGIQSAHFGGGTPVADYAATAYRVGGALTLALPVLIVAAVVTVPGLRVAPLRLASLLVGASFFLPVFLFDNADSAVLTYALAHGLQYWIFMLYVVNATSAAGRAAPASFRPGLATLAGAVVFVGAVQWKGGDYGLMEKWSLLPIFGLTLGVTMAHFVIDAGIWRLRDEFPRRYIGAAFPFLARRPS